MTDALHTCIAVRELGTGVAWDAWLDRLARTRGFWLLDSAHRDGVRGAWSFAGAGPRSVVRVRGDRIEEGPLEAASPIARIRRGDPFEALRALVPHAAAGEADAKIPFVGGAVGWLGYELAASLERVALRRAGGLGLPDAAWLLVDRGLALEHATGRCYATALGRADTPRAARTRAESSAEDLAARVARGEADPFEAGVRACPGLGDPLAPAPEPLRWVDPATRVEVGAWFDADLYAKTVRGIQDEIAAGDLYQANLTHRLAARFGGDAWRLQRALSARSPAPFAAYIALPEGTLVGSSPERFLRVFADGRVESRPIKGTRPRGSTPEADARLRAELAASEKERAENAMIVDLVRNDLGRVCVPAAWT